MTARTRYAVRTAVLRHMLTIAATDERADPLAGAACKGADPTDYDVHATTGNGPWRPTPGNTRALQTCATCPVITACRTTGPPEDHRGNIRGGIARSDGGTELHRSVF